MLKSLIALVTPKQKIVEQTPDEFTARSAGDLSHIIFKLEAENQKDYTKKQMLFYFRMFLNAIYQKDRNGAIGILHDWSKQLQRFPIK